MDDKDNQQASILGKRPTNMEGKKLPQFLITMAACVIVISGGTAIGWSSPAMPYLQGKHDVDISNESSTWASSILAVGAGVGALPAGSMAEMIGRKMSIMSLAIPLFTSWVMIFFARGAGLLITGRFIAGLGLGAACTVVPMYVAEIAEESVRGLLGAAFQLSLCIGILYAYSMGAIVSYFNLSIACGVLPLVFLLVFFRAPESPMYLLKKDKRNQAEQAIRTLRGSNYDVVKDLHAMENELAKQSGAKVSFLKAVSTKAAIKAMIICLGLMVFQQLSGINVVIFYASSIFKDAGSSLNSDIATILLGIAQVVATAVSAVLIDKAGRTILLKISGAVMAICLGVLGLFFYMKARGDVSSIGWIPLLALVIYMIIFAIGFGPIPWMTTAEILPEDIKGTGTGIAVGLNWALAFTVTLIFPSLLSSIGTPATYWLFSSICVISVIFTFVLVIETKGKSLSQIQNELSGKPTNRSNII